jgi:Type II secretion system (T2SS), protein M subtype b
MIQASSVARKILALGILSVLLGGIAFGVLLPAIQSLADRQERLEAQRVLLGRYQAEWNAAKDAMERPLNSSAKAIDPYLPGDSEALKLARLQALLKDAASAQLIRMASTRAVDPIDRDGVQLLAIQAQLTTELEPLQRLLFALEHRSQNLVIENITVMRGATSATTRASPLDVTLVVAGATPRKKD